MSFMKKIKDILFEEEEYTEPQKIRNEKKNEEPKEIIAAGISQSKEIVEPTSVKETSSERELFSINDFAEAPKARESAPKKEENTFQFPDFDEEEFASMSRAKQKSNILDYERKKKEDKKEYNRYEKDNRTERENKEVEKKKFKPSPIISPVYGILNEDYKAEDIVNRKIEASTINIEEVRKKAFEPKKEEPKEEIKVEDNLDPVVTFFEEKDNFNNKKDNDYKSIDSLLEEASLEIPLEDTLEIPKTNNLDVIEEELEKIDEERKENAKDIDDELIIDDNEKDPLDETLDSDLFELIDSMYDEREEE